MKQIYLPWCLFLLLLLTNRCISENYIHPDFKITKSMFNEKIGEISDPEIKEAILSEPVDFLDRIKILLTLPQDFFLLVDKSHALKNSYKPDDLVKLKDYQVNVTGETHSVRKVIMDDLLAMIKKANTSDVSPVVASAYRSYDYQRKVYAHWVKTLGQEQADRESARPGHSQHQLGTTIDFYPIDPSFAGSDSGKWLLQNAEDYGFSLSYPEEYESITGYIYEPWHYRYVGKDATKMIKQYFKGIQQYFLEFYHENADFFHEYMKAGS